MMIRLLLLCALLSLPAFAQDWWDTDWSGRTKITIDNTEVDGSGTHSNFAFCVDLEDLGSGHELWTSARSDGGDLRATSSDGTTQIACYVEPGTFSTGSKTGILWVEEDLSTSSDTDVYLYYGNSGVTAPARAASYGEEDTFSTWGNVWTLDGADLSGITDSTAQTIDGSTETGTVLYQETGKIGYGLGGNTGDGTDKIDLDTIGATYYETGHFAFSVWFEINSASGNKTFFSLQWNGSDGFTCVALGDDIRYQIDIGGIKSPYYAENVSTNTWYCLQGLYDGSNYYMYINSTQRASGSASGNVTMAANSYLLSDHGSSWRMNGTVDQIMVAKDTSVNADWLSTMYNNQSDIGGTPSFYSFGSHEDAPASGSAQSIIIWH